MTHTHSNPQPMPLLTLDTIRKSVAEIERIKAEDELKLRKLLDEIERLGLDPKWRAEFEANLRSAGYEIRAMPGEPDVVVCWKRRRLTYDWGELETNE